MRSHLHNRVSKIEQAMTGGKVRENEQDPALVSFLAKFGIPARAPAFLGWRSHPDDARKTKAATLRKRPLLTFVSEAAGACHRLIRSLLPFGSLTGPTSGNRIAIYG